MWWDGKIQRTFRCRLEQKPASLGRLLTAIGDQGGLIGEIRTIHLGGSAVDRDITVYADDLKHLDRLIKVVATTDGVRLLEVRDEVLELHQGGGFAFALDPLSDPIRVPNAIVMVREALVNELAERLGRTDTVFVHVTVENRARIPDQLIKLMLSA